MTFFFGDGFDFYAVPADAVSAGTYWDATSLNPGFSSLQPGRFSGSRSWKWDNGTQMLKTSGQNDAVHHFVLGFMAANITGDGFYVELFDGTTAQCTIVFSGGNIVLRSGGSGGAALATYSGAFPAISVWYAFEIEVVINNTIGSFTVRKNGNPSNDFFLGSLNTRNSANNYANKIQLGSVSNVTHQVDDFLWRSDAASVPWVGDVRCYTRMPASDAQVQWSRLGGATNFSQVSEAQQDGATTYDYSSTVGQNDLYGIASIANTPTTVLGVVTRGYFEKSDAGTRNCAVQLKSGGTTVQSPSTALNTVWGWLYRTDLVDPATSAAWTTTAVNNVQVGPVVTA